MNPKVILLVCFLLLVTNYSFSQTKAAPREDFDAAHFDKMANSKNRVLSGMLLPAFTAKTLEGKSWDNYTIKNKVTMIVFWSPTCGCFNFHKLDSIKNAFKENNRFEIVAMGVDTAHVAWYKNEHYMPYKYVFMPSFEELYNFNNHNGMPSFMIVDRDAVLVKVWLDLLDYFDAQKCIELIREQLLR